MLRLKDLALCSSVGFKTTRRCRGKGSLLDLFFIGLRPFAHRSNVIKKKTSRFLRKEELKKRN